MANYPQRKKKPEPEKLGSADDGSSYVAKQNEARAKMLNEASHATEHKADVAREKRKTEQLMLKKGGKVKKYAEGGKTDFPDQSAEARKKRMEMPADEYGKMVDKTMGTSKGGKKGNFNEEPDMGSAKKVKKYALGGITQPGFKTPGGSISTPKIRPGRSIGASPRPTVEPPMTQPGFKTPGGSMGMPKIRPGSPMERMPRAAESQKLLKKGGAVKSSASKRADGIATKGKTRGKMV